MTYSGSGSDGGTVPTDSNNYEEGTEVTVAAGTMTLTGYTFVGWNTAADGSGTAIVAGSTFAMGTVNVLLYAQWIEVFGISFDKNDADAVGTMATQAIASGSFENLTVCAFTKAGWIFAGWAITPTGNVFYVNGASYTMGSVGVTLYAKWIVNNYTITFDNNDADAMGIMADQILVSGSNANLTENAFVKDEWTFTGWSITSDGNVVYADKESYTMGSEDVTLYAKWVINNYTITFDKNDSGASGIMADQYIGSRLTENLSLCEFSKTGWTFSGWATTSNGSIEFAEEASYTIGTENITLYANWLPPSTYSLRDIGPAGGWIFYDDEADGTDDLPGVRYLEVAPVSQVNRVWGTFDNILTGADGTAIGTGNLNTLQIRTYDPLNNTAADECANYSIVNGGITYDNWFLPSKDELNEMYVNLKLYGVGGFPNVSYSYYYWSSSEDVDSYSGLYSAWSQNFYTGSPYATSKTELNLVRAIRAF